MLSAYLTTFLKLRNIARAMSFIDILNCSNSGRKMSMSGSYTKVCGMSMELEKGKESELTKIPSC